MILSLLADAATEGNAEPANNLMQQILLWVMIGALVVVLIVMFFISSRRNKKRQQEAENLMNSIKPGNKVTTIGGVCGIVVEVNDEDKTFVLETGSENSGKSYIKFDKQAIYQTDAVADGKTAIPEKAEEEVHEDAVSPEALEDNKEEAIEEKTEEKSE